MTPNHFAHRALSDDCAHEAGRKVAACQFCLERLFEEAMGLREGRENGGGDET